MYAKLFRIVVIIYYLFLDFIRVTINFKIQFALGKFPIQFHIFMKFY